MNKKVCPFHHWLPHVKWHRFIITHLKIQWDFSVFQYPYPWKLYWNRTSEGPHTGHKCCIGKIFFIYPSPLEHQMHVHVYSYRTSKFITSFKVHVLCGTKATLSNYPRTYQTLKWQQPHLMGFNWVSPLVTSVNFWRPFPQLCCTYMLFKKAFWQDGKS